MMPDSDINDLLAYEFKLACEHEDCDEPAAVMGRGCGDTDYVAVCAGHYEWIQRVFYQAAVTTCAGCLRPFTEFFDHYDIKKI